MAKKYGAARAKQKKVIKNLVENGGNLKKAIKDAGYADGYAEGQQITGTKTWKELLDEFLPDEELQKKHKELLEARKAIIFKGIPMNLTVPDYDIQAKALDMGYKLKGSYAPEKHQTVNPFEGLDNEELDEQIAALEKQINVARKLRKKDTTEH